MSEGGATDHDGADLVAKPRNLVRPLLQRRS